MAGAREASQSEPGGGCGRRDLFLPGVLRRQLATRGPNFLVISPPKTGSTSLADNFRCHPDIFVPKVKEVKYFSYYCEWLDLDWYLDHFGLAGSRLKGDVSPSYSILPADRIRWIHRLLPDLKLIFLMREPVSRAWSHAKHCYRFREANFASCSAEFEAITDSQWRENFIHEWPLASGDYLGQLQRRLSVFPREQFFIGFCESIAKCPQTLLGDIFAFLGAGQEVDFSTFRIAEQIFAGLPSELHSDRKQFLQDLLYERTRELAYFLREQFDLHLPFEWEENITLAGGSRPNRARPSGTTYHSGIARAATPPATGHLHGATTKDSPSSEAGQEQFYLDRLEVFGPEFDDRCLSRVLERGEELSASSVPILEDYRGYNVFLHEGGSTRSTGTWTTPA